MQYDIVLLYLVVCYYEHYFLLLLKYVYCAQYINFFVYFLYEWNFQICSIQHYAPNLTVSSVMNALKVITVDCQILRHLHKSGLKLQNYQDS